MPDPIASLGGIAGIGQAAGLPARPSRAAGAKAPDFGSALGGLVDQVNTAQGEADQAIQQLVAGKTENLHEVMLAVNKAELSFQFLMETRNKLVNAYQEVMRMQL